MLDEIRLGMGWSKDRMRRTALDDIAAIIQSRTGKKPPMELLPGWLVEYMGIRSGSTA